VSDWIWNYSALTLESHNDNKNHTTFEPIAVTNDRKAAFSSRVGTWRATSSINEPCHITLK
jgi:hypothetical protein